MFGYQLKKRAEQYVGRSLGRLSEAGILEAVLNVAEQRDKTVNDIKDTVLKPIEEVLANIPADSRGSVYAAIEPVVKEVRGD